MGRNTVIITRGRSLALVAFILVGLGVVMLLRWRAAVAYDPAREMADAARKVFADFRMLGLQEVDKQFIDQLAATPAVIGDELADVERKEQLANFVFDFLRLYYDESGPDRYMAWRESFGDRLIPVEELLQSSIHVRFYEYHSDGEPMPPELNGQELFERVWRWSRDHSDGANVPTRISADDRGFAFRFKNLTVGNPSPPIWPRGYGKLWAGGIVKSSVDFWKPNKPLDEALATHQTVLAGYFSAVLEFQDGSRRPWTWVCHLDPSSGRWQLVVLLQNNVLESWRYPPGL